MFLPLAIVLRIIANPISNVFQKLLTRRGNGPLMIICLTHALLSTICIPILFLLHPHVAPAFWPNITAVAVLTVAGNATLVAALKRSDLSLLGPVNAYKSVVSLVPGMILLREFPGWRGLAGIGLIVLGSYFIVDKRPGLPRQNVFIGFFNDRGVQYRILALILSAIEAVYLKKAMLVSSEGVTFAFWAVLGLCTSVVATGILMGPRYQREMRIASSNQLAFAALAVTTGITQWCTIVTFNAFQVGYSLALFQCSTLITVFLGYKVFRERNILERLIGSMVMIGGALLILSVKRR